MPTRRHIPKRPNGRDPKINTVPARPAFPRNTLTRPSKTKTPGATGDEEPSRPVRQPLNASDHNSPKFGMRANCPVIGIPRTISPRDPISKISALTIPRPTRIRRGRSLPATARLAAFQTSAPSAETSLRKDCLATAQAGLKPLRRSRSETVRRASFSFRRVFMGPRPRSAARHVATEDAEAPRRSGDRNAVMC